ncbi:hypothetical protein GCM10011514_01010 [Emticicia aquatilis]|uniref:Nucleotidyltransferase-Associated Rossmannoid Fold domain-containing protein n=1 Tax=Emticicia aquatilis TaxID=1537369 RepID=A0A917DIV9_9BACT|nr:NARF domain-containing protein [Emticicia aquatilis]GGD40728.1 hypothetical protein GCM10011514_01010 [Emticicia aquatilis]
MKQLINKIIGVLVLSIFTVTYSLGQKDSTKAKLEKIDFRIEKVEGFQEITKQGLDNNFKQLENKINDDYSLLKYLGWIGLGLNLIVLIGGLWKYKEYVEKKLTEKFDKIITQKEANILEILDKQDIEKQIVNTKKILVLSSKNASDIFIRKFFRAMGFPVNNVNFEKVDSFQNFGNYDLIFANNEDNTLDINLIQEFFQKSNNKTVLFFFGSQYPRGTSESDRMNLANSRTQIYGNLINLLRYQEVLK